MSSKISGWGHQGTDKKSQCKGAKRRVELATIVLVSVLDMSKR
jgi:hypothetical protein